MRIIEKKPQVKKAVPAAAEKSLAGKAIPAAATKLDDDRTIEEPSASSERARVLAIKAALKGDEFQSLVNDAIAGGWTLKYTKAAAFDLLQANRKLKMDIASAKMADLQARTDCLDAAKREYGEL